MSARRIASLAAVLVFAAPAAAQFTWTGANNTTWNNGFNWSPASVPNSVTATAMFAGQGSGAVNIALSVQTQSLTFSNGTYTLTSSANQTLRNVTSITVGAAVTGVQTIDRANVASGSLLFQVGG